MQRKDKHTMKYYYKNQKLRTSDNVYTHAVVTIDENDHANLWCCCGRYDLALKRYNTEIANAIKGKAMHEQHINEIDNGTYLEWAFDANGKWCRCKKLNDEQLTKTRQDYVKAIERCERIAKNLKIIELESK